MDPPDALDALAGVLRDRLVDAAGDARDGDDPAARIARRVDESVAERSGEGVERVHVHV